MLMIKRWREVNLGEGEADAQARAAVMAKALQHHIDGAWEENTPEDVRAYLKARWDETRQRIRDNEPLGVVKRSEYWGRTS